MEGLLGVLSETRNLFRFLIGTDFSLFPKKRESFPMKFPQDYLELNFVYYNDNNALAFFWLVYIYFLILREEKQKRREQK